MLTDPADPTRVLFEAADVRAGDTMPALRTVLDWAEQYLCRPHPDLGRNGHVCPYAQGSIDRGTFYLAAYPGRPSGTADVERIMLGYRDWFERLGPDDAAAQYRTILVAFPDLPAADVPAVIDATQEALKAEYVARGLMIGEFHDGPPDKAGLWNADFRPLRCPVPLLAIRRMVATDFPFLRADPELVAAYAARFAGRVPSHLRETVAATIAGFGLCTTDGTDPAPGTPVPLSPTQRRLWFLNQLDPGNPVHTVSRAWRRAGPHDLRAAAATVLRRHPVLRTTLGERDGQPVATVADAVEPVVEEISDLRAFLRRPFDVLRGPLLRVGVTRDTLVLVGHRLAVDDASLALVAAELDGAEPSTVDTGVGPAAPETLAAERDRLAGTPDLLTLPTDRPRPTTQRYRGARHRWTVPEPASADELLAAFGVLLTRHSGQSEVVVGLPVRTAGTVGPHTNPVAARIRLDGDPTFAELVRAARADAEIARSRAGLPFEELIEVLDVARAMDRSPVFQAVLDVTAESGAHAVTVDPGSAATDLTLRAAPDPDGGLALELEYSTDLFEPATARAFADRFSVLLAAALADPEVTVGALPLTTGAERDALVGAGAGPRLDPPNTALPLIARWVAERPDAVAVSGADGELTYRALWTRAARLAHVLQAWGVGPDTPVGLCLDRTAGMVTAMLGAWLAGAPYVPLDPAFPPARLRLMLDDAGVDVVVTNRAAREHLDNVSADLLADRAGVVCLDGDAEVLDAQPDEPPAGTPGPDDLAYVIYTSGSTGTPKGVEIPHRAVANLLVGFSDLLGLKTTDRWLAVTTLSFDIAALELLLPLACGARVIVADRVEVADGAALRRRAEADAATVVQATPATWHLLLAGGGVPATVHTRLCGGEAVPRDLADALSTDGATVWNVYGPTETTVWSAAGVIGPGPVEIGRPIANTSILVVDATGAPVPPGVVGEIAIGGLGVARGYHARPDLTAERFTGDPRLYRTGDLARARADGRLEFLGRSDTQVKVRGFRIELGEIEAALRADDRIDAAVVTAWTRAADDTRLVAYVVPADGSVDAAAVRTRLAQTLPEYMVPGTLVPLAALPLTPNGKVDRRALPEPEWGTGDPSAETAAPRNPVESALLAIWLDVLGLSRLGIHDDFFVHGGHSLLGARLLARVRAYFDVDVPMRSLFDAPTVAGLAEVLEALEPEPGRVAAIAEIRAQIDAMAADDVRAVLKETNA